MFEKNPSRKSEVDTSDKRSFSVEGEVRDDGFEYANIVPASNEGTPQEWREKLAELIKKLTG